MPITYTIGDVPSTGSQGAFYQGRVTLVETVNAANNSSSIAWNFYIWANGESGYRYENNNQVSVTINGVNVFNTGNVGIVALSGTSSSNPLRLAYGTVDVPHNSDGAKVLAVSATYKQINASYLQTIPVSGNVTLETIPRAAVLNDPPAMTLAASGTQTHTVTWTTISGYYYKMQYLYGDTILHTQAQGTSGGTYTWSITDPSSVAQNVTGAKTMTIKAVLHTYSDQNCTVELGSSSKTFVITFGDSFAPSITSYRPTIISTDQFLGTLVSGISSVMVTAVINYKASASIGSAYAVYIVDGKEFGGRVEGETQITLGLIPAFTDTTKTISVKYSITDSRGFTSSVTFSAGTGYGWVAPSVSNVSAYRCNSSGTADMQGNCYIVSFRYSVRSINNMNSKNVAVDYKYISQSTWSHSPSGALPNYSGTLTLGPYSLNALRDEKLEIRVSVSDALTENNASTAMYTILPKQVFIQIKTSGEEKIGLGIGKVPTKDYFLQLGWELEAKDTVAVCDENGAVKAKIDAQNGLTFYDAGQPVGNYPPDGSLIDIDTTLAVQGAAADAKAVGDALTTIRAQVGAPLVANTSSAMTDRTRIYVYTGTQSGYTAGNWYYYNGSSWVSGGVYNSVAVQTDETLTISGRAADAAITGARLNSITNGMGIPVRIEPTWQRKTIAGTNGYESASTTRISPVDFIPAPGTPVIITPADGMKFSLRFYTDSVYTAIITAQSTDWITGTYTINPPVGTYFKCNIAYTTDGTITTDEGENINIAYYIYTDKTLTLDGKPADAKVTGEMVPGVAGALNSNLNVVAFAVTTPVYTLRSPYVIMANGIISEVSGGEARYRVTDYIAVEYGQLIAINHSCARYNNRNYAFYDANYNVVAKSDRESSGELQINVVRVPVPKGAKFFAMSYDTQYDYPPGVQIITKWDEQTSENGFFRISNINESAFTTESMTTTTTTGAVVTRRGLISTGQSSSYILTNAAVTEGDVIYVGNACAKYSNAVYCFYDISGLFIDVLENPDSASHNYVLVAPKGATSVTVSGYSTAATIKKVTKFTLNTGVKWGGKKWAAMGDSLTEVNSRASKRYMDYIADVTGISVTNLGKSGTGYLKTYNNNANFLNRVNTIPTDSDVVTIFGSGNDCNQTLGSVSDTGTNTVCGCINNTIDNIRSRITGVKLGIITPTPWDNYPTTTTGNKMANYCDALVEICKRKGVPCLDLYRCSNMVPWDSTFRAAYYSKDDGNGVHPDENGHALFAPRIKAFLETLLM